MDVKQVALERALKMLSAVGAQYAVVMPDGTKLGTLELAPPKVLPRRRPIENKGIVAYLRPKLGTVEVGGEVLLPTNEHFSVEVIQRSASQLCGAMWGRGNYVSHKVDGGVQVLRCA